MEDQRVTREVPTANGPPNPQNETAAPTGIGSGGKHEQNAQVDYHNSPSGRSFSIDELAGFRHWVAWREQLNKKGLPTKVPFDPTKLPKMGEPAHASSTNVWTWGTRAEAERAAKRIISGGRKGGVGLMLGPIVGREDVALGGVDLDSCRDPATGAIAPWASAVLERFPDAYAEVSPSLTGLKVFFLYDPTNPPQRGTFKRKGGHHPPGIEIYLTDRYFAFTGQALGSDVDPDIAELIGSPPAVLRSVNPAALRWLCEDFGPRFTGVAEKTERSKDDSGSGVAYRKAVSLHLKGGTIEDFEAWAADHPWTDYDNDPDRAVARTWERAEADAGKIALGERRPFADGGVEAKGLGFLSPADCAAAPLRSYIVKRLLAKGDVGCVFGPPGVGKSLIAPLLAYLVSEGSPAFGLRTKPGNVLYVAAEDAHGMRGRVTALRGQHGDAPAFTLVEGVGDLLAKDSPDLKALLAAIEERTPLLVVVDTIAMAFPGLEENTAEAMGRVVSVARQLAAGGAAVLLIHHSTKDGGRTPRGHGNLNGDLDVGLYLERGDDGVVRGTLTKNRNGPCDLDIAFRIGTRELGKDEDGDPITAAIAEPLAAGAAPKVLKLPPSERAALDILNLLLVDHAPVSEDEWRTACVKSSAVSASDHAEGRRKATWRAISGLARKSIVEILDGTVSLSQVRFSEAFEDIDISE